MIARCRAEQVRADVAVPMFAEPRLTVNETAQLMGIGPREVRKRIASGRIQAERVRVGSQENVYLIHLRALPESVQRLHSTLNQPVTSGDADVVEAYARAEKDHPSIAARADARAAACVAWAKWQLKCDASSEEKEAFVAWYRGEGSIKISVRSLDRWLAAYQKHGIDGLVDGNDGSSRRGAISIRPELLEAFEAAYLKPSKPSVRQGYEAARKLAIVKCWKMPAYDAFWRYEKTIPVLRKQLFREPKNKLSAIRPSILRDYSGIAAMEIIQSDHHQIDVAVSCGDPACTIGHYPWITVWYDVRSRKVLDCQVYVEYPNSRRILQGLSNVWRREGLCNWVNVDNGMDYIRAVGGWGVKHFDVDRRTAKLKVVDGWNESAWERTFGPFGVQAIFATARNPQAKIIERWFRTLITRLYAKYDSYRGTLGDRSERAEYLRSHPAELPPISEFAADLQFEIEEYNDAPHRGEGMDGRSPNEVFASTRLPRREADPAALAIAFWAEKIGAKYQKDGVNFQHAWYLLPPAEHAIAYGKKFIVRYPENEHPPEAIVLCDANGRYVGLASIRRRASQARTEEGAAQRAEVFKDWHDHWRAVLAELRRNNPRTAARVEQLRITEEQYKLIKRRAAEISAPRQLVATDAGGGSVTVFDTHLSPMARAILTAEAHVKNPAGLSQSDLDLVAALPEVDPDFIPAAPLRALPPPTPRPGDERPASEEEQELELEGARLRELKRRRDRAGLCRFDMVCSETAESEREWCLKHEEQVFGR